MTSFQSSVHRAVKGVLTVPGDKSVSHRALMLSAIAAGDSRITGLSRKFSIPLAEYFDTEALTLRVGEIRRRR